MTAIASGELHSGLRLSKHLYHRTGLLLLRAGQQISSEHVRAFEAGGMTTLYLADESSEMASIAAGTRLEARDLDSLPLNEPLAWDLCNANGVVLLSRGQVLRQDHVEFLESRKLQKVWILAPEPLQEVRVFQAQITEALVQALDNRIDATPELLQVDSHDFSFLKQIRPRTRRNPQDRQQAVEFRKQSVAQARDLYQGLTQGHRLVGEDLPEMVNSTLSYLANDLHICMGLSGQTQLQDPLDDGRVDHLVNVSLLASSVGAFLGYDLHHLQELAITALLHDVGMSRVPKSILMKKGPLDPLELLEIQRHPIHGVNMIEKVRRLPSITPLVIYQTHERPNGKGYNKQRHGMFIHDYAKIIAVADCFAALRSPRPHRPALLPYQAMESVVRMAAAGILDHRMVKALLQAVGLYPIGSWVQLNTGQIGRVVGLSKNRDRFDRPRVSLLYDLSQGRLAAPLEVDLLEDPNLKVQRAMPAESFETDPLEGF